MWRKPANPLIWKPGIREWLAFFAWKIPEKFNQLQTNFLSVRNWALDLFKIFWPLLAEKSETNKCCKGTDLPSLLIYFRSVGIPPVERLLVPPVLLTLATGPGSAPHSTEVMCLPWHCPAAPGEQWLRAGITSGLSDPGHGCQDKQPRWWKSGEGGSVSCFSLWSLNLSPSCLRAGGKWPDSFIWLLMLPLRHPELVMIVERLRYLKRKRQREPAWKNIWQHSALTKIDGHCVQVCLADPQWPGSL